MRQGPHALQIHLKVLKVEMLWYLLVIFQWLRKKFSSVVSVCTCLSMNCVSRWKIEMSVIVYFQPIWGWKTSDKSLERWEYHHHLFLTGRMSWTLRQKQNKITTTTTTTTKILCNFWVFFLSPFPIIAKCLDIGHDFVPSLDRYLLLYGRSVVGVADAE